MQNVNIFSRENANLIVNTELNREVNEAEKELMEKVKGKSVLDYQTKGRLMNILKVDSADSFKYLGINFEGNFIDEAKKHFINPDNIFVS